MPDLPRPSGARRLLIAGIVLGLASIPAAALPGPPGQGAGRVRTAPVKPASLPAGMPAGTPAKFPGKASAEPETTGASAVKPVSAGPAATWTSGEGERACFRGRRKLWQEGEGWIVKKVSVCP